MPKPVEAVSAEQGERCQLCGSLVEVVFSDEGTSCYRPASAEQGDVVTWVEEAQKALHALLYVRLPKEQKVTAHDVVWVALNRLAAALERSERERDEANAKRIRDLESWEERANASENKALFHDDALARAEKAERALADLTEVVDLARIDLLGDTSRVQVKRRLDDGRHPSEDTSDES